MIKLQNDFTTQEQSKRLLDLGVPVDSADCCVENTWEGLMIYVFRGRETYSTIDKDEHPNIQYPCWSVGRLIEIMQICCDRVYVLQPHETDIMQVVIEDICALKEVLDFSKLEELC